MKSIRLFDTHNVQYRSTSMPDVAEGEVLLQVSYCGICRTDAKMWDRGHRDLRLPRVLGHEFCARTDENKKVVVWPGKKCGVCVHCLTGCENMCADVEVLGFHRDGGMAEYVTVPIESLIEVPANLPEYLSPFAEPMACGINALQQLNITADTENTSLKNILIVGGGTCGLLLALVARVYGFNVTVLEVNDSKLLKSEQFKRYTGVEILSAVPKGLSFDYALNATSAIESLSHSLQYMKPQGAFCVFSGFEKGATIPIDAINEIHYRQLSLHGAYGCTKAQMIEAIDIIAVQQDAIAMLIEDTISMDTVETVLPKVCAGETFRYIININKEKN